MKIYILPDTNGVIRKLYFVLTHKIENGQMGCINRDENTVNNMIKIVNHYLDKKERPLKYRREYNLEKGEIIKKEKQKVVTSVKKGCKLCQKEHCKLGGQVSTIN